MLTKKPITDFLTDLASSSPAPGGGSVAALAGAMGAALISMVCSLTIGKKKYAEVESEMKDLLRESEDLRRILTQLVDKDTQAFSEVMDAFGLPRETEEEKTKRSAAIQASTKEATLVPLEVMRHSVEGLTLAKAVAEKGNVSSVSDAGVSAIMLYGALESAALNVQINLGSLEDKGFVEGIDTQVRSLQKEGFNLLQATLAVVREKMARPG